MTAGRNTRPLPWSPGRPWNRAERAGALLALVPLALWLLFLSLLPAVAAGGAAVLRLPWVPELGLELAFYIDGLALLFALLITGIGALVLVYAGGYLAGYPHLERFYLWLLLFMGAMLGVATAGNLLTLFVFWELTSISSYLLIGFQHDREPARKAALQALLVTGGGGLALLAGLVLLGLAGGTFSIPELLLRGDLVRAHPLYAPILILVLLGAATKSAQFPFHFWLPGAMEAPTPVSAYLHSATMVKAGVFLLARLSPALAGTDLWTVSVTALGTATMLAGGYLSLCNTDLKRILAYSTVSALGALVLLLGLGTPGAVTAAVVFLFAHALYKGAIFMVAGAVDHETGTRDVERLGGLRRRMFRTAVVAGLAGVSLAGLGPVLSFIGKELLLEAVLEAREARVLLTVAAVLSGSLFTAVALIVAFRPFFGPLRETPKEPHEAPPSLLLGPALLAVLGFVMGFFPGPLAAGLLAPAVASVLGYGEPVKLSLWHGVNPALSLSVVSFLGGLALYGLWERLRRVHGWLEGVLAWGPARSYQASLAALDAVAGWQTRGLQTGYLRHYVTVSLIATVALTAFTMGTRGALRSPGPWTDVRAHELVLAVTTVIAALTVVLSRSRLGAVAALGVVGYTVALTFLMFGAPDVAMTQFLIETLTVILFVLAFYHLPPFVRRSSPRARVRDAVIALSGGGLMTALVLMALGVSPHPSLSHYFVEQSVPAAHGRNIVNVILVDFRALDTLGEITVLAAAAAGVHSLLKLRLRDESRTQWGAADDLDDEREGGAS